MNTFEPKNKKVSQLQSSIADTNSINNDHVYLQDNRPKSTIQRKLGDSQGKSVTQLMKKKESEALKSEDFGNIVFNKYAGNGTIRMYTMFSTKKGVRNIQVHDHDAGGWTVRWAGENQGNQDAPEWVIAQAQHIAIPPYVPKAAPVQKPKAPTEAELKSEKEFPKLESLK